MMKVVIGLVLMGIGAPLVVLGYLSGSGNIYDPFGGMSLGTLIAFGVGVGLFALGEKVFRSGKKDRLT